MSQRNQWGPFDDGGERRWAKEVGIGVGAVPPEDEADTDHFLLIGKPTPLDQPLTPKRCARKPSVKTAPNYSGTLVAARRPAVRPRIVSVDANPLLPRVGLIHPTFPGITSRVYPFLLKPGGTDANAGRNPSVHRRFSAGKPNRFIFAGRNTL